jgi:hypothetical protein
MEESILPLALFELWFILRNYPSGFPALRQFYETAMNGLSADQTRELVGFVSRQKVCFMRVACSLY